MKLLLQLILSIWNNNNNRNSIVMIDDIIKSINDYCDSTIDIIELELILLCIDDNDNDVISFSNSLSSISPSLSLLSSFISLLKSSLSSSLSLPSSSILIKVIYKRNDITSILNTNSVSKLPWLIIIDENGNLSNNFIDVNVMDNNNVDIDNMFTKAIEFYNSFELMNALQVFDEILSIDKKHKEYPILSINYLEQLLLIDPSDKTPFKFLWALAQAKEHRTICISAYTNIANITNSIEAKHKLSVLTGIGNMACKGDPLYARIIYDDMAEKFETKLVSHLGYRGPWILFNMLKEYFNKQNDDHVNKTSWRILDCGCGSGLVGRVFAEYVGRVPTAINPSESEKALELKSATESATNSDSTIEALKAIASKNQPFIAGIDISQKMVDITSSNGGYDAVICGDLEEALQVFHSYPSNSELLLDLIIAADTFIYIGALGKIFNQVKKALKKGAYFAFSVEALESSPMKMDGTSISPPDDISLENIDNKISDIEIIDNEPKGAALGWGIQLLTSARYAHSQIYIHILAHIHGYDIISKLSTTLRTETSMPLEGFMYLLKLR